MTTSFPALEDEFADREFRTTYVDRRCRRFIAHQLRTLREDRNLSQQQVADLLEMKQSAVSRLENPEYGRPNINTLLKVAAAYDVALVVRFATYDDFIMETRDISPRSLTVKSYDTASEWRQEIKSTQDVGAYQFSGGEVVRLIRPERTNTGSSVSIQQARIPSWTDCPLSTESQITTGERRYG